MTKQEAYIQACKHGAESSFLANVIYTGHRNPARKLKGLVQLLQEGHSCRTGQNAIDQLVIDGKKYDWAVLESPVLVERWKSEAPPDAVEVHKEDRRKVPRMENPGAFEAFLKIQGMTRADFSALSADGKSVMLSAFAHDGISLVLGTGSAATERRKGGDILVATVKITMKDGTEISDLWWGAPITSAEIEEEKAACERIYGGEAGDICFAAADSNGRELPLSGDTNSEVL